MATLTVQIERHDNIANFDAIFNEVAIPRMTVFAEMVTARAQALAPVDRGYYRGSITNDVTSDETGVTAQVYSTADPIVVNVIETGRAAGTFPNLTAITDWTARVLQVSGAQLKAVAFLVGRKIKLYGIPGRYVFQTAAQDSASDFQALADEISAEVAARLSAGS